MRVTPMLEQYWGLKREAGDAILLYRLGDFYEMFFEDAETAAPLLGLVLTARHRDSDIEAPMCGIPWHQLDPYVAKLVAAGKKVAIADQTEAPQKGKTLVARKIVRIVTPGTVLDPERLDARRANEMAAVAVGTDDAALAFLDLSTGDFSVTRLAGADAAAEGLRRRVPAEIVCFESDRETVASWLPSLGGEPPVLSPLEAAPRGAAAGELLRRHFRTATLEPFGLPDAGPAVEAAASLLHYARTTQQSDCAHVTSLRSEPAEEGLVVDAVTAGHLELFRSLRDGSRTGTLLDVVDRTSTAFGARALRKLLERPLGEDFRHRGAPRRGRGAARGLGAPRGAREGAPRGPRPAAAPLPPRRRVGDPARRGRLSRRASSKASGIAALLKDAGAGLFRPGGEASPAGVPVRGGRARPTEARPGASADGARRRDLPRRGRRVGRRAPGPPARRSVAPLGPRGAGARARAGFRRSG